MLPWSSEIHQKKRRSYLNGLFIRAILEEKYGLGTEETTPAASQEPQAHPGTGTTMASFRNSVSPSVPLSRLPLIFVTLLKNCMEKQTVAQGCILLTVFSTGNFITQVLIKENKTWMSINIWSYLAAGRMFVVLITILPPSFLWGAL